MPPPLDHRRSHDLTVPGHDPGEWATIRRSRAFRVGLFCWYAPLASGLAVFAACVFVGAERLLSYGVTVLATGVLTSLVGAGCALYILGSRWPAEEDGWGRWRAAVLLIALVASDYVVAVVLVVIAASTSDLPFALR